MERRVRQLEYGLEGVRRAQRTGEVPEPWRVPRSRVGTVGEAIEAAKEGGRVTVKTDHKPELGWQDYLNGKDPLFEVMVGEGKLPGTLEGHVHRTFLRAHLPYLDRMGYGAEYLWIKGAEEELRRAGRIR